MKSTLPAGLRRFFLEPPSASGLVYDLSAMKENARLTRLSLKQHVLNFAVKSLPDERALSKILPELEGVDISNAEEFRLLGEARNRSDFTVWLTRCSISDLKQILSFNFPCRLIYTAEKSEDLSVLRELREKKKILISLRVCSTELLSSDHPLTYESRFGFGLHEIETLMSEHPHDFSGIHIHHGSQRNNHELLAEFLRAFSQLKDRFPQLEIFNVGGGWNLKNKELVEMISKSSLTLTLEPGRFFSESFGYAFCRIDRIREKNGTLIEGQLSPEANLKWLQNPGFFIIPMGGKQSLLQHPLSLLGPSCFEGDVLPLTASGDPLRAGTGDILVITNVSGYSMAWNKSFNGISTPVYFVGESED